MKSLGKALALVFGLVFGAEASSPSICSRPIEQAAPATVPAKNGTIQGELLWARMFFVDALNETRNVVAQLKEQRDLNQEPLPTIKARIARIRDEVAKLMVAREIKSWALEHGMPETTLREQLEDFVRSANSSDVLGAHPPFTISEETPFVVPTLQGAIDYLTESLSFPGRSIDYLACCKNACHFCPYGFRESKELARYQKRAGEIRGHIQDLEMALEPGYLWPARPSVIKSLDADWSVAEDLTFNVEKNGSVRVLLLTLKNRVTRAASNARAHNWTGHSISSDEGLPQGLVFVLSATDPSVVYATVRIRSEVSLRNFSRNFSVTVEGSVLSVLEDRIETWSPIR